MQVFAVIAPSGSDVFDSAVRAAFPDNFFEITPGQYLVAVQGLVAEEIAQKIGDKGTAGRFLILPLKNYYGWHKRKMWEWANSRMQG